jgi:3-hydroxybutyryl-CoA dehydrogenase
MSVQSIGIIGTGLMGRGIAEVAALSGLRTTLVKWTAGEVAAVRRTITASFDKAVGRGKLEPERRDMALARLQVTADRDALRDAELAVESVVEDLEAKQALFAELEGRVEDSTVLATNTSSLRVGLVGGLMRRVERLLGLHFFSPVPAMKLVEIAPTNATAPFAVERARALVALLGKTPVLVGDSSGYIVNRLLVPYLLDGIRALEAELAAPDDIDTAMRLGCGHPMGPLALSDLIGLDVVYAMARTLYGEHHDRRYSPPALLRRLVLASQLGKKTGIGLYDYSKDPAVANPALRSAIRADTQLGA